MDKIPAQTGGQIKTEEIAAPKRNKSKVNGGSFIQSPKTNNLKTLVNK